MFWVCRILQHFNHVGRGLSDWVLLLLWELGLLLGFRIQWLLAHLGLLVDQRSIHHHSRVHPRLRRILKRLIHLLWRWVDLLLLGSTSVPKRVQINLLRILLHGWLSQMLERVWSLHLRCLTKLFCHHFLIHHSIELLLHHGHILLLSGSLSHYLSLGPLVGLSISC